MSETLGKSRVQELAEDLVAMCKAGRFDAAGEKYWADDVVSLEPTADDMARTQGKDGVKAKGDWWSANHEIHSVEVEGPYVHGEQFVVRFKMDLTPKGGQRMQMDEVGLYTVRNGKIAEERFFYGS